MPMGMLAHDHHLAALIGHVFLLLLSLVLAADSGFEANIPKEDLSLWIDENQVYQFSGTRIRMVIISGGSFVLTALMEPNMDEELPVIPSEVSSVNFTWKSGEHHNYYYMFDQLKSYNEEILHSPVTSIEPSGFVPKQPQVFQVLINCVANSSGIATFTFGLKIINVQTNTNLSGTPIRLKLKKQCSFRGPDPECDKKCGNGKCNQDKICVCPTGFVGKYCESALCYPQCMNGGTCVAPGSCLCKQGFQGRHCEGGLCSEKCLNGGKCIQKDTCSCRRGYYGLRCQYSKCLFPCLNGGKCIGVNRCRCKRDFSGNQCQNRKPRSDKTHHKKKPRRKFV